MDCYPFSQQRIWPNPGSLSPPSCANLQSFLLRESHFLWAGFVCVWQVEAAPLLPKLPGLCLWDQGRLRLCCRSWISVCTPQHVLTYCHCFHLCWKWYNKWLFVKGQNVSLKLCEGEGEVGGGNPKQEKRQRAKEMWWNACSVSEQDSYCTHLKLPSFCTTFLAFFLEASTFLEQLSHQQQSTI